MRKFETQLNANQGMRITGALIHQQSKEGFAHAVTSIGGNSRLFANHDDSINVVNIPGILDTSTQAPAGNAASKKTDLFAKDLPGIATNNKIGSLTSILKADSLIKAEIATTKLQEYEAAVKKIKESTGVSDIYEIIQKFAT
jgi:hypothetical protein